MKGLKIPEKDQDEDRYQSWTKLCKSTREQKTNKQTNTRMKPQFVT